MVRVSENASMAFYAAEAGLDRVRARITKGGTDADIVALDGRSETFTLDNGDPGGSYQLSVVQQAPGLFTVVSEGHFGSGMYTSKRVVRATLQRGALKPGSPTDYRVVTTYLP